MYVCEELREVVVAFRGTEQVTDMLARHVVLVQVARGAMCSGCINRIQLPCNTPSSQNVLHVYWQWGLMLTVTRGSISSTKLLPGPASSFVLYPLLTGVRRGPHMLCSQHAHLLTTDLWSFFLPCNCRCVLRR